MRRPLSCLFLKALLQRRTLVASVGALSLPAYLSAQVIAGTVRDSTSGVPMAGALVSVRNGATGVTQSALTDGDGAFAIRLLAGGAYQIVVRQIGSTPPPPFLREVGVGERVLIEIVVHRRPISLAAVGVREASTCESDRESNARVLLSQFLLALQALSASEDMRGGAAEVVHFVQYLDPASEIVQADTTHRERGRFRAPFTSVPANDIAQRGFVRVTADGGVLYLAPSAATLASTEFLNTHCFRAVPASGGNGVALYFEPAPGRRMPDLSGIARFDSSTLALKSVAFAYVNTPHEAGPVPATGRVEFERMRGGAWWVSAWDITAPAYESGTQVSTTRPTQLRRAGGVVIAPELPTRLGALVVQLPGPGRAAFAVVSGSGRMSAASSTGEAEFGGLAPGKYVILSVAPSLPYVPGGLAIDTITVVAGETKAIKPRLTFEAYGDAGGWCGRAERAESRGAVVVVLTESGLAPAGRSLLFIGTRQERQAFDGFRRETFRQPRRSSPAGMAWICGREENEEVSLVDGTSVAGPRMTLGKVARRRLLVRHVRLPLSTKADSTDIERR